MNPTSISEPLWWLPAFQMYAVIVFLGWAAWPWWSRCWSGRTDRGAGLWPVGGICIFLLAGQFFWRTGLMELRFVWMLLLMASIGLAGVTFLPPPSVSSARKAFMRRAALRASGIFTLLFVFWTLVRGADPGVMHTEQPMDVMWMRAAIASDRPPIGDAWFGGKPATYYVDGHQALGFLTVQAGLHPANAVNAVQILWFALTGLLAFQTAATLCPGRSSTRSWAGILAIGFLLMASTPQGMIDALGRSGHFWWWSASRVIQDGATELITEFPFFSFYLGDNHAHLIGLPILLIAVLGAHQLIRSGRWEIGLVLPSLVCIVWSWRINPWQTPTVMALFGMAMIFRKPPLTWKETPRLLAAIFPLVFLLWPARAPGPSLSLAANHAGHSSALDLMRVFGFLVPGVLCVLQPRIRQAHLVLPLLMLSAGMLVVPEFLYLEDVFQNRMNTVFKVYYQVWVFLAVCSAVGWASGCTCPGRLKYLSRTAVALCLIPASIYAIRLSGAALFSGSKRLNAWSAEQSHTRNLLYIADNLVTTGERILEAPGTSYDAATSRLGTWTAGDTLLGWTGHQAQWRPGQPQPDPLQVYRADHEDALDRALKTLQPDWVLLSTQERNQVTVHPDWERWMDRRADRVINEPGQILYRLR